jgi:PAS domain S-box-containing protein
LDEVFNIVNEFTRKPVESPAAKVLREGNIVGLANHTVLISKTGGEVPIDDSGAPIRSDGSAVRGVVLVFRDVTERRAAEIGALRLASIVQNSNDAIISKNLSGVITTWNEGAERIFGYKANEVIGKSIKVLVPPESQQEEDAILDRLRGGEKTYHFETTRVAKGGRLVPVSLTISPIKDHEGLIVGASKIARDITEQKNAEALMAKARDQLQAHAEILEKEVRERTATLEKIIAELEAFSYSLSHDMRAPLRTINSFSEIVLNEHSQQMDEEGREFLKKVIAAARRMDKLILDLLAFTRISRSPVTVEPINVEPLLRGILQERVEFQPPAAEITIESPLAPVLGNEASLTQSFSNLLDNAVKFVEPGETPKVRIRSERNGSTVRLWFEDNGIGVDDEGKQRLFQIFERIHSGDYPGFGLGLAIVRKAMERMGGQVGVESEPGNGSRFWLQLPGVKK